MRILCCAYQVGMQRIRAVRCGAVDGAVLLPCGRELLSGELAEFEQRMRIYMHILPPSAGWVRSARTSLRLVRGRGPIS